MMINTAKLISVTPDAEKHMAYCARVSNPANQDNEKFSGLLKYCVKHQHWSIFEQAYMTLELTTTRGIAAQVLRHRSFTYQEFSQRYADSSLLGEKIPLPELRRQDEKNRQKAGHEHTNRQIRPKVVEAHSLSCDHSCDTSGHKESCGGRSQCSAFDIGGALQANTCPDVRATGNCTGKQSEKDGNHD